MEVIKPPGAKFVNKHGVDIFNEFKTISQRAEIYRKTLDIFWTAA